MRPPDDTGQAGRTAPSRPVARAPRPLRVAVDGRVMQNRYHGIGRHTFELVRHLADRDVDLVVVRDPTEGGRFDVDGLGAHPSVRLLDLAAPVTSLWMQARWPRLLASVAPDVLLVPYHLASPWVHPRVPTVAYVHDCIFETDSAYAPGGPRFRLMYRLATRLALSRATAVATVSQATRWELRRHYGVALDDDAVIPHGVGEQFLALDRTRRPPASAPGASPYVLHVGVQRPHKNHAVLLTAFADVARVIPEVRLILVGDADTRFPTTVPVMIRDLEIGERVEVRSHVDDDELLQLYQRASAFAFPSLVEGFGLPVLEAMAAGVPTVTSDAAAVVEASHGASLVAPALEPRAWADALIRILTNPVLAADLTTRGRGVAAHNTWEHAADCTLRLLERLGRRRVGGRSD